MEVHGSGTHSVRKEITCGDCGHKYIIAQGQPSARCLSCGNIEFFSPEETKPEKLSSLSQAIASRNVLPRLQVKDVEKSSDLDPLLAFKKTPDGGVVEALRIRYQVEWQLWAVLVKSFHDPAMHMAYLCQATAANQLEIASQRYKEHRSVMALLPDSRWQADVSELMLSRIEKLSLMRMSAEGGGWWSQLPILFYQLQTDRRAMRYIWVTLGIVIFVRIFSLVWWK